MKTRILSLSIAALSFCGSYAEVLPSMREVFRAMPDSILPTLTQTNRLDMLDFCEAKMRAAVTDRLDTECVLDTLCADYLSLSLGDGVRVEMKLVASQEQLSDTADCLVVVDFRYGSPSLEGNLRLYTSKWHICELPRMVDESLKRQLVARPDTMSAEDYAKVMEAVPMMTVDATLSPADNSVLLQGKFPLLSNTEKQNAEACLTSKRLHWNGKIFK